MARPSSRCQRFLADLIAIPSVNPGFLPKGDSRAGEHNVAAYLSNVLERAGVPVEFQTVFPNRANLLARVAPSGKIRKRVLLCPHMDTVGGEAPPKTLFGPRTRNGRMHGR